MSRAEFVRPLPHPADVATRQREQAERIVSSSGDRLLFVDSFSGGLAVLREADGTVIASDVPWIGFAEPAIGDKVVRIAIPGRGSKHAAPSYVAIGPIQRTLIDNKTLAFRLWLDLDYIAALRVRTAAGDTVLNVDTTAGLVTGKSFNSPVFDGGSQNSADTGTTASTTVYADAMTGLLTLPVGTWSVWAHGGLLGKHSAGTQMRFAVEIDGIAASRSVIQTMDITQFDRVEFDQLATGIAGNRSINMKVRFRASAAGTVTGDQPSWFAFAWRTS